MVRKPPSHFKLTPFRAPDEGRLRVFADKTSFGDSIPKIPGKSQKNQKNLVESLKDKILLSREGVVAAGWVADSGTSAAHYAV